MVLYVQVLYVIQERFFTLHNILKARVDNAQNGLAFIGYVCYVCWVSRDKNARYIYTLYGTRTNTLPLVVTYIKKTGMY